MPLTIFQWDFPKEICAIIRKMLWEEPFEESYDSPSVLQFNQIFYKSTFALCSNSVDSCRHYKVKSL